MHHPPQVQKRPLVVERERINFESGPGLPKPDDYAPVQASASS